MNDAGMVAFVRILCQRSAASSPGTGSPSPPIADTGGGWSQFHGLPVIDESGAAVFRADRDDGAEDMYTSRGGVVRTVAETGDVFETLARFPSVDDRGVVAFAATLRGEGSAIVTVDDGDITIIDTEGAFESFRGRTARRRCRRAHRHTAGGNLGLFNGPNPETDKILAIGDHLLGSTVADLAANPVSINAGGQVAVRASLADGRQFILRADPVECETSL